MRPRNLISVYQGDSVVEASGREVDKRFEKTRDSKHALIL